MATYSSIPAWEIPWTEKPDGLQSMELQRIRHDLATKQQQGGSLDDRFLDFSSFLIYTLNAIVFLLSTVFSVSCKL